jgi:hypothetical protein
MKMLWKGRFWLLLKRLKRSTQIFNSFIRLFLCHWQYTATSFLDLLSYVAPSTEQNIIHSNSICTLF